MNVDYGAIGQRIKQVRRSRDMTQERLAEALSVSVGYISQIERGVTKINLDTLAAVAAHLNCELSELVTGVSVLQGRYLEGELAQLVAMLAQFEQHIEDDSPLAEVLPSVYNKYPVRYRDYTLRQLCQEMHDLYVSFDVKDLQKAMFRQQSFPSVVMNPQDAHSAYIRGEVELVRIRDAEGRIAAEGALPYPPGVLCVVPGEVWGGAAQRYFLALEEGVNLLPGFSPELQGVYSETDADGMKRLYGYVLK